MDFLTRFRGFLKEILEIFKNAFFVSVFLKMRLIKSLLFKTFNYFVLIIIIAIIQLTIKLKIHIIIATSQIVVLDLI